MPVSVTASEARGWPSPLIDETNAGQAATAMAPAMEGNTWVGP